MRTYVEGAPKIAGAALIALAFVGVGIGCGVWLESALRWWWALWR